MEQLPPRRAMSAPARVSVRKQASYTVAFNRAVLSELPPDPPRAAVVALSKARNINLCTLRYWTEKRDQMMAYTGLAKRKTVGGQERRETKPFASELVAYMKSTVPRE